MKRTPLIFLIGLITIILGNTEMKAQSKEPIVSKLHFLKYKVAVKDMVTQLDLVEVSKIALDGKPIN